jgi:hypothetical protein
MILRIKGVKAPLAVKSFTPFSISFKIKWVSLLPWKRERIYCRIYENGNLIIDSNRSFIPHEIHGVIDCIVWLSVDKLNDTVTYLIDVGEIDGNHKRGCSKSIGVKTRPEIYKNKN